MRKLIIIMLLAMSSAAFAQQQKPDARPEAAPPAKKEPAKPDPLLLTDVEQRELNEALNFIGQAKKQHDDALDEAHNTPIERMNALEVLGKLQKAWTLLQGAHLHFADVREKHKEKRPDCQRCEYAPDARSLVRPNR